MQVNSIMRNDKDVSVLIAGDTVPTDSNSILFTEGDITSLFGDECVSLFHNADLSVINLETPLVSKLRPIKKFGPILSAEVNTVQAIKNLGVGLVSLANNHIKDQGVQGIEETISVLENAGIDWIGVGENKRQASQAYFFKKNNLVIGFYSVCENEFSNASKKESGANALDICITLSDIYEAKQKCNYLIVLYHGGKEEFRFQTPFEQNVCRKMIDMGADVVLAQHSHCIGTIEQYENKYILYGQGNFIFDLCNDENWKTGLLVELNFKVNAMTLELIPIVKRDNTVRIADNKTKEIILSDLKKRSESNNSESNVMSTYRLSINESLFDYIYPLGGRLTSNRYFRWLDKKTNHKLLKTIYSEQVLLAILNSIRCETHREELSTSINIMLENYNK